MAESRVKDIDAWLAESREQFTEDYKRDRIDRDEADADNDFANSPDESKGQWSVNARKEREDTGRPVLQFNRIPTYLQHIANAGRQNKPAFKVTAGDNGTPETAEMWEGRLRYVEYDSDASTVWDTARDQQVSSGRAFVRIITEELPNGKQVVRIARIENQFSVIFGPHRKYDASDADRCWVFTRITKDEHKRRFGKDSVLNQTDFAKYDGDDKWNNLGDMGDMVQIAEKFVKEYDAEGELEAVCRYVINGKEILEEGDFITDDIPIVPQWGREAIVKGIMRHFSLHNPGKDWQRLINLAGSNIAELIGKQPKTRYNAAVGSIAKHHEDNYASNAATAILYYIAFDESGRPYPKPEFEKNEPAIQAAADLLQIAIEGLKSSMGIYDASMGQRSNETSGVAINRRKVEGEVTNYHFPGNEERTRKRVGEIVLKALFVLDKNASKVPIRHENGKTETVPIGTPYPHPRTKKPIIHDLSVPQDYGIEIESGPSYPNAMEQKQEAEQALITAVPELMLTELGVNFIRNSGRPGADEDADALTRYINMKMPGLIPDKDGEQQIPPKAQAMITQLQQKLQTTDAFAQSLHQQIQTKQVENQAKVQMQQSSDAVKLEIAKMQEETKRVLGLATIQSEEAQTKLEQELGIVHKKVDTLHEQTMQARDHAHAAISQQSEQAHAAGAQAAQQEHDQQSQATDLAASAASQGAAQEHEAGQAEEAAKRQQEMEAITT